MMELPLVHGSSSAASEPPPDAVCGGCVPPVPGGCVTGGWVTGGCVTGGGAMGGGEVAGGGAVGGAESGRASHSPDALQMLLSPHSRSDLQPGFCTILTTQA